MSPSCDLTTLTLDETGRTGYSNSSIPSHGTGDLLSSFCLTVIIISNNKPHLPAYATCSTSTAGPPVTKGACSSSWVLLQKHTYDHTVEVVGYYRALGPVSHCGSRQFRGRRRIVTLHLPKPSEEKFPHPTILRPIN